MNSYSGETFVNAGTLNFFNGNASASGTQSLGGNADTTVSTASAFSAVNLGVAGVSSGTLAYNGTGAATLAKHVSALGNGNDTIQNSGTGLLTLSGTLTKNGTTLTLNGGANGIAVTGQIVGAAAIPTSPSRAARPRSATATPTTAQPR